MRDDFAGTAVGADVLGGATGFPLLVLREEALAHNLRRMADYCAASGVVLAPHGKTHLSPQLWERQRAAGAVAVTVATVSQARVFVEAGARDVVVANQLVDAHDVSWVQAQRAAGVRILLVVDSLELVELLGRLAAVAPTHGPALDVLVEVGYSGGRAGARDAATATAVAERARALGMRVRGIEGFEGLMPAADVAGMRAEIGAYLASARAVLESWLAAGLVDEPVATFGGSSFFDQVVEAFAPLAADGVTVMLRSGCYLTHDHGLYADRSPWRGDDDLRPALELWARVLSLPEPGHAIVGFGRRDAPTDAGLPIPLRHRPATGGERALGGSVAWLNDQHAALRHESDAGLAVGDLVAFGISHPCTAFQCWTHIPVLDADDRLVDVVRTHF